MTTKRVAISNTSSPQSHKSIGRLPGLGDEEAHVVTEDWSVAVQEVRGQVHHDGQLRQFLQELPCGDGRVVRRAAGNE